MNLSVRLKKEQSPKSRLSVVRFTASALAVGTAIAISSFTIVRAEHANPAKSKSFNCSTGTACLAGHASGGSTLGILGTSGAIAIEGLTNAANGDSAIAGVQLASAGGGAGVYGSSAAGPGVYGISTKLGTAGIAAYQLNTTTNPGNAIYAESADATGSYAVIYAQGDSPTTPLVIVNNNTTGSYCEVASNADLFCSGTVQARAVRTRRLTSGGQHVLAYAAESASETLEDVGTGRMIGGVANVAIDRAFGSTIDRSAYRVFLTPKGDASLYVGQETPAGFVVRETHGGRSTLDFDYRIIARPIDATTDRLPVAPATRHFETGRQRPRAVR
jgi:hypothetical protein